MKCGRIVGILLLVGGCGDDGSAGGGGKSGGDGTDTDSCSPGAERCPCVEGECLGELVCLSDVCVEPDTPPLIPPDVPDDSTDSGETGAGTGTGGDAGCAENAECLADEVCVTDFPGIPQGGCIPAELASYTVTVHWWDPPSCSDGGVGGNADLYWVLQLGADEIGRSTWKQGGCPGSWSDESLCVPQGAFSDGFQLILRDEDDPFSDDTKDRLWWDADNNAQPDPIPTWYLHDGVFDDMTADGGILEVYFDVGCV